LPFRTTVVTDGNIVYNDDATTPVFSSFTGRVGRLYAKLGDEVKKGAPLFSVDASEFVQGQSDAVAAKANLDTADATEKRAHGLYEVGAGALKDWRQSQSDLVAAQAAWNAARGRLKILGKSDADIDAFKSGPAASTETIVGAPIAGTIIQRQVGVGQYIASASGGATSPVYTIGNLSTVWMIANVRESDVHLLHVGQAAEVSVAAFPGKTFDAKVEWIGSSIDPVTHRLPVRATVKNPGGELKAQMFASFSIATSASVQNPAVPQGALVFEGDNAHVLVLGADGAVAGRAVKVGRSHDGMVEVVSGLQEGEQVVTAGTLFVDRAVEGN
jgi:cobalt-zinc-cadmium efflux system membrane fusion protein